MSTLPSESRILSEVRLAAGNHGLVLWRNNVAQAWTGEADKITRTGLAKVGPGDVVIRNARPLHAGLCKGSSDLIGLKPIVGGELQRRPAENLEQRPHHPSER